MRQPVLPHSGCNGVYLGNVVHHADLYGKRRNILTDCGDLLFQKRRRNGTDLPNPCGVLRRQRCNGAHAKTAQHGHGFQVCLDAGAAAAVTPGNGQNRSNGHRRCSFF